MSKSILEVSRLPSWNTFSISYNPHFREYHAIREATGCSVFSSSSRSDVVNWIKVQRQPIQLNLFD